MTVKVEKSLGYCLGCDYPLDGLTGDRCPECGRPFDRGDARTRNTERPIGRFGRFCMRPFGWGMPIMAVIYIVLCFWETRVPMGPIKFPFASRYVGAFLWILWMTRVMARLAFRMRYQETDLVKPGGWRLAWLVSFLIVLSSILVGWNVPVLLAFKLSQGEMQNLARSAQAAPTARQPARWVGLYKTKDVTANPIGFHGVQITVAPPADADPVHSGFAYCPENNIPARIGNTTFEKLTNDWYVWRVER